MQLPGTLDLDVVGGGHLVSWLAISRRSCKNTPAMLVDMIVLSTDHERVLLRTYCPVDRYDIGERYYC